MRWFPLMLALALGLGQPRTTAAQGVRADTAAPADRCEPALEQAAQKAFEALGGRRQAQADAECQHRLASALSDARARVRVHFTLDADQCVPRVAVRVPTTDRPERGWHRRTRSDGWSPPVGDPATAMPVALPPAMFLDRGDATVFVGQASAAERRQAESVLRVAADGCLAAH